MVTFAVRLGACSHPVVQIRIKLAIEPVLEKPTGYQNVSAFEPIIGSCRFNNCVKKQF